MVFLSADTDGQRRFSPHFEIAAQPCRFFSVPVTSFLVGGRGFCRSFRESHSGLEGRATIIQLRTTIRAEHPVLPPVGMSIQRCWDSDTRGNHRPDRTTTFGVRTHACFFPSASTPNRSPGHDLRNRWLPHRPGRVPVTERRHHAVHRWGSGLLFHGSTSGLGHDG